MWLFKESASLMAWRAPLGQWEGGWQNRCDPEVAWLTSQFFTWRTQTAWGRQTGKPTNKQIHILLVGTVDNRTNTVLNCFH